MYDHKKIEAKWQRTWEQTEAFRTTENAKKKFYVLDMFPYPSGAGLHVGHPKGYTATDIIARYKRLNGFDVLHPIGWDAFGLPAEQYAIQTGNHPASFTQANIKNFRRQIKALGFSFDYAKEVDTTDPAYYKWTQWIVSELYKKGLAEKKEVEVNWCEGLGTVLANEEVLINERGESVSERGGFPVVKRPLMQWVLKITTYASRLYDDLKLVDWPASLVALQKNWIKNPDGSLHLKDWIFSRQRYWGEPFPFAFNAQNELVLITDLPVVLPKLQDFKPVGNGESPLVKNEKWLYFKHGKEQLRRETNTMPQWAGSNWYYLAYILKNADGSYTPLNSPEAKARFKKWLPVDLYIGGQEHAVLHLLYARFWHKVLFDLGIVHTPEPFQRIINQGMILGEDNQKMSKSRGNVINPDAIITEHGADTLRLYEMFMGPLEDVAAWSEQTLGSVRKWLERVYRLVDDVSTAKHELVSVQSKPSPEQVSTFNAFVRDITHDIEHLKFNTAISKMMIYINYLYKAKAVGSKTYLQDFALILSLFAPHIGEELRVLLGAKMVKDASWPKVDEAKIAPREAIVAVQVNGKTRATLTVSAELSKAEVIALAKQDTLVKKHLTGATIAKTIFVPGRIVNFVLKSAS